MSSHTQGPWGTDDGAEVWPMEGKTSFVTLCRVVGPWSDSTWYGTGVASEGGAAMTRWCHCRSQWVEELRVGSIARYTHPIHGRLASGTVLAVDDQFVTVDGEVHGLRMRVRVHREDAWLDEEMTRILRRKA